MATVTAPVRARRLFAGYLRPHRGSLVALAVGLIAATVLPLLGPQLLRHFVDAAIAGRPLHVLVAIAVVYLLIAAGGQSLAVVTTYGASRLAWATTNQLREDVAEHALRLDMSFHAKRTAGEMIERVDGDVNALTEFLSQFVAQAIGSALLLVGALVLVWREDWRAGAVLTALVGGGVLTVWRGQRWAVPLSSAHREQTAQLFGSIEERLVGVDEIRANGAGAHVMRRFHEAYARLFRTHKTFQVASGVLIAVTSWVFALGSTLMLAAGILLLRRGEITVGTVLLLFQYSQMVRRPVEQLVGQAKQLQEAGAGVARVAELLRERAVIVDPIEPQSLSDGGLSVRLRDVTFAYGDDPPVLHDVDLSLAPGRSLGLVGRTGSGKTTIARLLTRLCDPVAGAVEIDGADLRNVALHDVRRRVAMVTQDVQLFGANLRDNLTLFGAAGGNDQLADDVLLGVLRDVGLGAWVASLPSGLDTLIGPDGTGLSAGESQLVAFARAFLSDPGVVVLDEAASRLDPATEALVDRATARLLAGRTAVVIAHRLSSLTRVDDIAVIEDGRVVEHGPRRALAADSQSRFAHLLELAGVRP